MSFVDLTLKILKYLWMQQNIWVRLWRKKINLVYGGDNLGLMGAVLKDAQNGGSHVLGIIPKPLADESLISYEHKL